jgi:NADH dehydrogenase
MRGVDVRLGARVEGFADGHVRLAGGETIETSTFVWTAGTEPSPLLRTFPFPKERGRIAVNERLEVEGHPGVWAVGDCARVPDSRTGGTHPPTAQHAIREGRTAARNIRAAIDGRPLEDFRFATLGQLAAIGRRSGVARILGFRFSGFLAWWLWRTIYLSKLPGLERKVRVMIDWTLDVLFSKDLVQIPTHRTPAPPPEPAAAAPRPQEAQAEPVGT